MGLIPMNPRHRRSPKNLLLNDVFTDWESGYGIFSFLENKVGVPWSNTSSAGLDIAYHGERSGEKFIAPMVYHWIDEDGDLTSEGVNKLVSAIKARYYQKWEHLWSVYTTRYSPLDTYNITETGQSDTTGSDDKTSTRTPNLTEAHTGTDNLTITRDSTDTSAHGHVISDGGSDTETLQHGHVVTDSGSDTSTLTHGHIIVDEGEPSTTTAQQVKGFNSADYVDKVKETTDNTTDNTQTHSGDDVTDTDYGKVETNSGSDVSTTLHGKTETHSGSDIDTLDYDATENRVLNLSNRTTGTDTTVDEADTASHNEYSSTKQGTMYRSPAELLSLDRDFWLVDYFGIVFDDVDHMLTLGIYSERTPTTKIF